MTVFLNDHDTAPKTAVQKTKKLRFLTVLETKDARRYHIDLDARSPFTVTYVLCVGDTTARCFSALSDALRRAFEFPLTSWGLYSTADGCAYLSKRIYLLCCPEISCLI